MTDRQKANAVPAPTQPVEALLSEAMQHVRAGRFTEARSIYESVLRGDPGNAAGLHYLGVVEHQLGNNEGAIALVRRALESEPGNAYAYSDLAVMLIAERRHDEAIEACCKAVALNPIFAAAHANLGGLLLRQGHAAEAERAFARAAELRPSLAELHAGRAEALAVLGRLDEAAAVCDRAHQLAPNAPQVLAAKGLILYRRGAFAEAAAAFEEALRIEPGAAMTCNRLGNAYHAEGRFEEAAGAYQRAIEAEPDAAEFHCNKALALQEMGRFEDALGAFFSALTLKPDFADAMTRLGILLHRIGQGDEALAALRNAVELAPGNGGAHLNLAGVLKERDQLAEAAEAYRAMFAAAQPTPAALFDHCHLRRHLCDWSGLEDSERAAIDAVTASGTRVPPFAALAMACRPEDHLALARLWASGFKTATPALHGRKPSGSVSAARRISLGYISTDFYDHATASLAAELFELHDRARFELFGYCFSHDDASDMRRRLIAAFDRFTVLRNHAYRDAAEQIAGDGIDILIDLKGYTRGARTIVLAHRPAPIQVNYLGYPSTMGAPFVDYVIADPFVAPMEHQCHFDEKIVHLPGCYQPNDRQRRTASAVRTRADHGLPEQGFVFCAFNGTYKITAEFFGIWMRLLARMPGSVLWLLDAEEAAKANLRREAASRGVDPARLIFAPKLHIAEHQARYTFADLFLDNLPVNAHTTASEALWAGLPLLTCAGEVFVGRVAGSLLHACGLPELVTHSLEAYESLALRLATTPALLAGFRARLQHNRLTAPLFDTQRYARNLEDAFAHMVRLHESGRSPETFTVQEVRSAKG